MNLLVDTQLLIWAATAERKLSVRAKGLIADASNSLFFSAASLWEIAIKSALGRSDFRIDAGMFRAGLLANGYVELAVEGRHCVAYKSVPALHRDPFDRLLVAQAISEGLTLVTADKQLASYGDMVLFV
jgi:PIN domain nuclease of toxin-antitoxin system